MSKQVRNGQTESTAMKSKRRVSETEDSNIGIKRFLYSEEGQSQPDDGKSKKSPSAEAGLAGGLVIKSFYGNSSKCSYLNPLERKTNRENNELVSIKSICQLQDTPKSPKEEAGFDKTTKQSLSSQKKLEIKQIKKSRDSTVRKLGTVKKSKQISTKPLNTKSTNSSETNADSHNSFSDNSGCASVNSTPNKFFRNRSPRKHALLSRRGPAVLINRGFSVKFQLTPGPKLQKPQQKVVPKISTVVQMNRLDQLAMDENQNHSSKDQIVAEDEQHTYALNVQKEVNDDEVDTAATDASSAVKDAATQEVNKEKIRISDVAEIVCETDPRNELNASVSDLFALSETSEISSSQSQSKDEKKSPQSKLFPIFAADLPDVQATRQKILTTSNRGSPSQPKSSTRSKKSDKEQMILDFGQKLIGSVPCSGCGMTYLRGDSADEMMHNKFHQRLLNALKFTGWQKERVVQDFLDGSRVIMIIPDDKFALKKLEAIKNIVDEDLGFVVDETLNSLWKAFLFVKEKKVVGFCLAQSISHGYRMLADSQSQENLSDRRRPFCCGDKPESVRCGISRIWVLASERRKHIATKLLDVVRSQFLMGYPLSIEEIAFSDPTPDGIKFASEYTKTSCFLVFRK